MEATSADDVAHMVGYGINGLSQRHDEKPLIGRR